MGNRFTITVVGPTETWANEKIDLAVAEISRIEKLLTTYTDDSQTAEINLNAGIKPVVVDSEVFELIKRAQGISKLTDGAFDLSYGSLEKSLWNFDQSMTALPSDETAAEMVKLINYQNIVLDENFRSVFLKEKGMRIGFGGIGKGYAADKAKAILIENGVNSGIVNASGDLTTWGNQASGKPWTIALAHPDIKNKAFSSLDISNLAVATSGNYEKFVMINGKKYSHTINPKTGLPITGIKSVSVICTSAELADAMATPVTILGVKAGLGLINQMKGIACVIIDDTNTLHTSKNINLV
ncbi:FAD:protein FMN transferase [Lacihabitans lacunae]|uniref:FAD:protein FMN transferase n=1 Tax=Lacihabitans lacunae TaxID=1028214 RepID=A0ABV7YX55_9BACT